MCSWNHISHLAYLRSNRIEGEYETRTQNHAEQRSPWPKLHSSRIEHIWLRRLIWLLSSTHVSSRAAPTLPDRRLLPILSTWRADLMSGSQRIELNIQRPLSIIWHISLEIRGQLLPFSYLAMQFWDQNEYAHKVILCVHNVACCFLLKIARKAFHVSW